MFFSESKNLSLKQEEILSDVEAQYYSFLGEQGEMKINLAPYVTPKNGGNGAAGLGMIKLQTENHDEKSSESQSRNALPTHSEHFMPYLMKFMLENKIGVLPYQCQLNDRKVVSEAGEVSYDEIRRYNVRERVQEIDDRKIKLAQNSAKKKSQADRKANNINEEVNNRFSLAQQLENEDSDESLNIHGEEASENSEEDNEDHLDDPGLYFGEGAKDKFWDFYKSERKFKDFNAIKQQIEDPRQAYFQTCNELGVFPRAKLIIRDDTDPEVEYSNVSLLSKSSIAVAQALKRYQVPIDKIIFSNNGIKQEETILLMGCLTKHYENIKVLNISKNKIGIQGVKCIASALGQLKSLLVLDLSHDEIGDAGILELITEVDNQNPGLEELNLSGNEIGKNYTYFSKYVETFIHYLTSASRLQTLKLANNNLRGSANDLVEKLLICF